jgi:hypothetical protein
MLRSCMCLEGCNDHCMTFHWPARPGEAMGIKCPHLLKSTMTSHTLATTVQLANHLGKGHKRRALISHHLIIPPYWIARITDLSHCTWTSSWFFLHVGLCPSKNIWNTLTIGKKHHWFLTKDMTGKNGNKERSSIKSPFSLYVSFA